MNRLPSPRPRLTCRSVRLWSSVAERKPAAHLANCADCRQFFAASAGMEAALRNRLARPLPDAPADLERGILHAVRASNAATATAPHSASIPWVRAGAVAAAALAVVAIVSVPRERPAEIPRQASVSVPRERLAEPPRQASSTVAPEEVVHMVTSAAALTDRWWRTTVPSTTTLLQQNALQEELASVYADARSALDFLALNFLPTTTASSPATATPRSG